MRPLDVVVERRRWWRPPLQGAAVKISPTACANFSVTDNKGAAEIIDRETERGTDNRVD